MRLASCSIAFCALFLAVAGCSGDPKAAPTADVGLPPGAPATDSGSPLDADTDLQKLSDTEERSSDAGEFSRPRIRVIPPSYTFLAATHATPEQQTFLITNAGNAKLIIYKVIFAEPSAEFGLLAPPIPNAELEPIDAAPDAEIAFQVRYQPIDEELDDRAVIKIHSNDPERGVLDVELRSKRP